MSLVSDALKKAERDAARREAREKGLPEPLVAPGQPFRARRRAAAATSLVSVALGSLTIAALAWLALSRRPSPPLPPPAAAATSERLPMKEAAPATPAVPAGLLAPESPSGSVVTGAGAGSGPARETALVPAPLVAAQPSSEVHPRPDPAPPSLEPLARSAARAARPAPTAAPAAPSAERVFVRTAALADGSAIRLGGIAWSAVAPLAYLNGQLVGVGEAVSGWRVERIERERVVLAGDGGRIVIALR